MVGLPDIAPGSEEVPVGKYKVLVTGVSAGGIAILLGRFPELRQIMTGKGLDADRLIELVPEAVPAVIAAGLGAPGDEEQEARAGRLAAGPQLDLIVAIIRVTLPGGLGPLVKKLQALGISVAAEEPAGPAPRAGTSGKARASRSRKRSKR